MGLEPWVWIVIAAVVVVIIIIVVVASTRGKGETRNRERAAELRSRAAEDDQLISTRQDRTDELEAEEEAARQEAIAEYERAEALRKQAAESDERAAHATDQARVLHDEATHSREAYETAVAEHEETLREADRRDPDVRTDRHGNRVEDEIVVVVPDEERLDKDDDYSGDEFAEPDAEYIDPVEHERLEQVDDTADREERRDDDMIPEPQPSPDVEYIDPVEHDRLAQRDEAALAEDDATLVDDTASPTIPDDDQPDPAVQRPAGRDEIVVDDMVVPAEFHPDEDVPTEYQSSSRTREAEQDSSQDAPALDPYGNPVAMENDEPRGGAHAVNVDDIPRDEQGRRLDPYGNPVQDDPADQTPVTDPTMTDDADDDIPRDEQGRRLDPYGNPVPENLQ